MGQISHAVGDPYFKNDQILKEYTELLNRLSVLADEMSGFFYRLKKMEIEYLKSADADIKNPDKKGSISDSILPRSQGSHESLSITSKSDTPYDCLRSILDE